LPQQAERLPTKSANAFYLLGSISSVPDKNFTGLVLILARSLF